MVICEDNLWIYFAQLFQTTPPNLAVPEDPHVETPMQHWVDQLSENGGVRPQNSNIERTGGGGPQILSENGGVRSTNLKSDLHSLLVWTRFLDC